MVALSDKNPKASHYLIKDIISMVYFSIEAENWFDIFNIMP